MRSVSFALALTLLAAPAAVAQQTTAVSGPTPGELPTAVEAKLPARDADTRPVRAEAQQVKTERVEVASRQEVRGNAFYLIGIAVVIVAVIALVASL
ncbi:hypothetical protein BH20GEM2_BH20GEM2_16460 [soil metagenome]